MEGGVGWRRVGCPLLASNLNSLNRANVGINIDASYFFYENCVCDAVRARLQSPGQLAREGRVVLIVV